MAEAFPLMERPCEVDVLDGAEDEALLLQAADDFVQFPDGVRVNLMHQHNPAFVCADGGNNVLDEIVPILCQYPAGQGLPGIHAAIFVESPVAGVHMPADDAVSPLVQEIIGRASGIAIRIAEQQFDRPARGRFFIFQHFLGLLSRG